MLVTLFVVTGLRGIDFGFHWDEKIWQLTPARTMVSEGLFLARPYNYPAVGKLLVLVPALDKGVRALWRGHDLHKALVAMVAAMDAPDYLLQARSVFLVISALGIVWVYLTVWVLTSRWWQATLAAAIFGLSWELAYHARWLVNDCLLAQFAALCLLLLALHHRRGKLVWLWAAAIVTGLATGTKYQGILLLAPVMLGAALRTPAALRQRAAGVAAVVGISIASYLVTTPGTVLDPVSFANDFSKVLSYYATSHNGYSTPAGLPHLGLLLCYLEFNLFSPYAPIALLFFASAVVGGVLCWRDDRRFSAILIGFPVFFATYFCWKYSIFIVRNYLLLAPFLAVLSARGLAEGLVRLRRPGARLTLAIAIGCALVANAAWLISASQSIRHRDSGAAVRKAIAYVRNHPNTRFLISPKVRWLAASRGVELPANATANADEVIFFAQAEGPSAWRWTVNDPWLTRAVFGPREINFNYYSTWAGFDRVVVMTIEKARAAGIPLSQ